MTMLCGILPIGVPVLPSDGTCCKAGCPLLLPSPPLLSVDAVACVVGWLPLACACLWRGFTGLAAVTTISGTLCGSGETAATACARPFVAGKDQQQATANTGNISRCA